MNLLTHLFINECELAPGSEWKDSSPGWKIILVSKGWFYWIARTEVKELKTGDVLVVGPAVEGLLRASQISAAKVHFFFFQPEHLVGMMSLSERLSLDAFTVTAQTRILPADSAVAKEFADLTENVSRRRSFFYRCRILHLVAMIFGDALPNVSQPRTNVATTLLRFEEIISRISDADLINYTSEQLSEMCGCSLRHFRRMFRKQFKTSIRAKQTELRLEKARQLLTETDDKTSTIAHAAATRRASGEAWRGETGHGGSGQGLPSESLCERLPRTRGRSACGLQDEGASARTGWPHHDEIRLPSQPAAPQTSGGDLRLDEDGGRTAAQPLLGTGANPGLGLLCGWHLQSAPAGAAG